MLARSLGLDTTPAAVRTHSWSVFSHFEDVGLFEDVIAEAGGSMADYPYPCDDAALHHLLEDGWIWVLRFNNGVTSAGFCWTACGIPRMCRWLLKSSGSARWSAIPRSAGNSPGHGRCSLGCARAGCSGVRACAAGEGWAMLAHAAYFLDALFSGGNAHSLLTIQRLARILEQHWGRAIADRDSSSTTRTRLLREADYLDRLIHGCYRALGVSSCSRRMSCTTLPARCRAKPATARGR